jgi:hypothetical protein
MPCRIQQKPSTECMLWLRRQIQLQSTGDMWQRGTRSRPLNILGGICEHLGALLPSRTIFVLGWLPHHTSLEPSYSFLLPHRAVCGWSHGNLKLNRALRFKCPDHTKLSIRFPTVKLLGIMFKNRCWPITFHTFSAGDADRWCQKRPV